MGIIDGFFWFTGKVTFVVECSQRLVRTAQDLASSMAASALICFKVSGINGFFFWFALSNSTPIPLLSMKAASYTIQAILKVGNFAGYKHYPNYTLLLIHFC